MKKQLGFCIAVTVCGLLVALGPQFIFKVCDAAEENFPRCNWSAQAEIGVGLLIAALGLCVLLFLDDAKIRLGLSIGVFFAGIVALLIPHALIGGCGMMTMQCRRVAFPALSVVCVVLLLAAISNVVYLELQNRNTQY